MNVSQTAELERVVAELEELRREITKGLKPVNRGELLDVAQVFEKLRSQSTAACKPKG